jgi:hypothetical protein
MNAACGTDTKTLKDPSGRATQVLLQVTDRCPGIESQVTVRDANGMPGTPVMIPDNGQSILLMLHVPQGGEIWLLCLGAGASGCAYSHSTSTAEAGVTFSGAVECHTRAEIFRSTIDVPVSIQVHAIDRCPGIESEVIVYDSNGARGPPSIIPESGLGLSVTLEVPPGGHVSATCLGAGVGGCSYTVTFLGP